MADPSLPPVEYAVSLADGRAHLVGVECRLREPEADAVEFVLPVWTPGSYLVREYARSGDGTPARESDGIGESREYAIDARDRLYAAAFPSVNVRSPRAWR